MRMLHFDGLTALHFAVKLLRRIVDPRSNVPRPMSAQRTAQVALAHDMAGDPAAMARFAVAMMTLTPRQAAVVRARGLLTEVPFRPRTDPAVARLLTIGDFNSRLRVRHRKMLERNAPALLDEALWQRLVADAIQSAEDEVGGAEL
jgi:hypothetical protein